MHSFATDGGHVQQSRHRWQAPPALLPGEADLRKLLQLPEQYLTPEIHDAIYREVTRQELERRVSQESVFIGVRKRQRCVSMLGLVPYLSAQSWSSMVCSGASAGCCNAGAPPALCEAPLQIYRDGLGSNHHHPGSSDCLGE